MLTVHQVAKQFGVQPLLSNITFHINRGERWGLIGPNGSGKTTLLRIIAGQMRPDAGHVSLTPPDATIGYLTQGFEPDPQLSVQAILDAALGSVDHLADRLTQLGQALVHEPENDELQGEYDAILNQLSRLDNSRAPAVLAGLGLDDLDLSQPAGFLSGGQKTRLALALILMSGPDLLLLDEPTNHLDVDMQIWLEAWLADFAGAILIVSHDRTFLDNMVSGILDLDPLTHSVRAYAGNYSDYLAQYESEREKQWTAYRDQAYEIRRLRQDIARVKQQAAATERRTTDSSARRLAMKVARKAKSREKKLERYLDDPDRVEKPARFWKMKLDFDGEGHLGQDVLETVMLSVGYEEEKPLLHDLNLRLQRGERVVLSGRNGSGKTTLLRTLAGQLPPLRGHFRLGHSVQVGYMSQEQELFNPAADAVTTIAQAATMSMTETEIRSFLHYFLFVDDEPLQPIHTLSFGQRARLALARLVVAGCNFLLLDQPVNHLDMPSRARFEHALSQFEGTILAVVHDRYFIERFATRIWSVDGDSIVVVLPPAPAGRRTG